MSNLINQVTVIIINYNYGQFLEKSILSVLNQTQMPNAIHFSDDYSDDDSMQIASKYQDQIKIFRNPKNLGVVDHLNLAINRVESELILILSADDLLAPTAIESLVKEFAKNDRIGVAYFDVLVFGELAKSHSIVSRSSAIGYSGSQRSQIFLWKFPDFSAKSLRILASYNFITGSSMFRKSAFIQVGGFRRKYPEDHDFWFRILSTTGYTALHVGTPLLYYRQHSRVQFNSVLAASEQAKQGRVIDFKRAERLARTLMSSPKRTLGSIRFQLINSYRRTRFFGIYSSMKLVFTSKKPKYLKIVNDFEATQNL